MMGLVLCEGTFLASSLVVANNELIPTYIFNGFLGGLDLLLLGGKSLATDCDNNRESQLIPLCLFFQAASCIGSSIYSNMYAEKHTSFEKFGYNMLIYNVGILPRVLLFIFQQLSVRTICFESIMNARRKE
jgi:hypothetical protein